MLHAACVKSDTLAGLVMNVVVDIDINCCFLAALF